jgi:hypothetical protein
MDQEPRQCPPRGLRVSPWKAHRLTGRLARLLAVALFGAAASCAPNDGQSSRGPDKLTAPPQIGTAIGIDVTVLPIDDTQPSVPVGNRPARLTSPKPFAQVLAELRPAPVVIPEAARSRWAAAGFGIAAVATSDLAGLESSLRVAAAVQRQQFSMMPRWGQAFRGPFARTSQSIELGDGTPTDISQGAFRLLMRCYAGEADNLRLDLMPQHVTRGSTVADAVPGSLTLEAPVAPKAAVEDGVVFETLLLEIELPPGSSLIVFSAPSGTLPSGPPAPPAPTTPKQAETATPASAAEQVPDAPTFVPLERSFGPDVPELPTLADATLTDVLGGGRGNLRAIVIFSPRSK